MIILGAGGQGDKRASSLLREGGGLLPAPSKTCGEVMEAEAQTQSWAACLGRVLGQQRERKRKRQQMVSAPLSLLDLYFCLTFIMISSSISSHQMYVNLVIHSRNPTKGPLCAQLCAIDFAYIISNP